MMEDIGNEVDLYSLADEMTETEDLLENEEESTKTHYKEILKLMVKTHVHISKVGIYRIVVAKYSGHRC